MALKVAAFITGAAFIIGGLALLANSEAVGIAPIAIGAGLMVISVKGNQVNA